MAAMTSFYAE